MSITALTTWYMSDGELLQQFTSLGWRPRTELLPAGTILKPHNGAGHTKESGCHLRVRPTSALQLEVPQSAANLADKLVPLAHAAV